jgi:glyoxylase-like metal-dependent hydrolase (beta-lactamase superfamily II)
VSIAIHPVSLGADQCYIIRQDGVVMVDAGVPKRGKQFRKQLNKIPMNPDDIQLVIITHGHWDHIGSAKDIKEMTGAKIAMHHREKDCLEKSLKPIPPAVTRWGRIFAKILAIFLPIIRITPTEVDILFEDKDFSLAKYGISGKVMHTPGHSSGSVSIVLDTGDAFVGDLAMNGFPLRRGPGLPIFADDIQKVKESWKLLLDSGVKKVYPSHGKPFSAEVIRRIL